MNTSLVPLLVFAACLSSVPPGESGKPYTPFHPDLVKQHRIRPPASLLDNPDIAYYLPSSIKGVDDGYRILAAARPEYYLIRTDFFNFFTDGTVS